MEIADLPGNDASWYRALLEEEATRDAAGSRPSVPSLEPSTEVTPVAVETPDHTELAPDSVTETFATGVDPESYGVATDSSPEAGEASHEGPTTADSPVETDPAPFTPAITATITEDSSEVSAELSVETADESTAEDPPADISSSLLSAMPRSPDDASPMEKTSEMVGQLWTARKPEEPMEGWEPGQMDRKMDSSRPFRWTSVIAALAVVALVIVGLVLLPSITRNRAANHRDMMIEAMHALRAEMPDTQASLQVATEPSSTVSALNDLSTQLTSLSAKATALNNAGRSPLPATPPLTSSGPIEELVPVKQRLEPLATTALTIQRRIANLVQYRTLMHDFLVLPELPNAAEPSLQADLRVSLASAQAESASILAEIPDDVSLSDHSALAREINDQFASWQVDYLEALRTQDATAADTLVAQLLSSLEALDAELLTPLAQIRRQTDTDLIDLASSIDDVIAIAIGTEPTP